MPGHSRRQDTRENAMPDYSPTTVTDGDSGSSDGSGPAAAGGADTTDASSRSERSDLSPGSVTADSGGTDRPSVGAGQRPADGGGSATGDAATPTADSASAPGHASESAAGPPTESASASEQSGITPQEASAAAGDAADKGTSATHSPTEGTVESKGTVPQVAVSTDSNRGETVPAADKNEQVQSSSEGSKAVSLPDGTTVVIPGMNPETPENKETNGGGRGPTGKHQTSNPTTQPINPHPVLCGQ